MIVEKEVLKAVREKLKITAATFEEWQALCCVGSGHIPPVITIYTHRFSANCSYFFGARECRASVRAVR